MAHTLSDKSDLSNLNLKPSTHCSIHVIKIQGYPWIPIILATVSVVSELTGPKRCSSRYSSAPQPMRTECSMPPQKLRARYMYIRYGVMEGGGRGEGGRAFGYHFSLSTFSQQGVSTTERRKREKKMVCTRVEMVCAVPSLILFSGGSQSMQPHESSLFLLGVLF